MTLIERLEAAETGSRELSDECLLAVGWQKEDVAHQRGIWLAPSSWIYGWNRPDPSRNLQDALDWMVPEGAQWSIDAKPGAAIAYVGPTNENEGDAVTPACALSAASLRAHEAMEEKADLKDFKRRAKAAIDYVEEEVKIDPEDKRRPMDI